MSDKLVSIVIVSFNCQDVLEPCILSCLGIANTEVIVVDNHSSDQSPAIIEKYEARITALIESTNHGFTKACNLAIDRAIGECIFLLNPDAQLQPDTVSKMLKAFEQDSRVGAVAPTLMYPDGTFQNYTRRFPTLAALTVASFVPVRFQNHFACYRKYQCEDIDFSVDQFVEQPAGAALMYNKGQYCLDETFFVYGSDVELCKNIIDDSYKILQITSATVVHHQSKGGTGVTNSKLRVFLDLDYYYAMGIYFQRHGTSGSYAAFKLLFGIGLLLVAILSIHKGRRTMRFKFLRWIYFLQGKNLRHLDN